MLICSKCKTEFEGNFCTNCGSPAEINIKKDISSKNIILKIFLAAFSLVVGVVLIIIVVSVILNSNHKKNVISIVSDTSQTTLSSSKSNIKATINKAEFDKIQNGMTYEEVLNIIGGDGEVLSEIGKKGESYYLIVYTWYGDELLKTSNAVFTFQDGKLILKAQDGLK
jgi:hypothetical protein